MLDLCPVGASEKVMDRDERSLRIQIGQKQGGFIKYNVFYKHMDHLYIFLRFFLYEILFSVIL